MGLPPHLGLATDDLGHPALAGAETGIGFEIGESGSYIVCGDGKHQGREMTFLCIS